MKRKPPIEYPIATVADFAKVPDDRLHDCLQEFCGLLINHRINLQRPDFDLRLESWTWVDDGIHMVREVHLMAGDQTETIPNPHFPKPKRLCPGGTPMDRWTCEWGGMTADIEAQTRSKARYIAFKILKEYWGLRNLLEIKVRRSTIPYPITRLD